MNEIKCPHCGEAFKIDEAGYAEILSQVRDDAFHEALHERLELAEQEKKTAVELATVKAAEGLKGDVAKKDTEIERLKAELDKASVAGELALKKALGAVEKLCTRLIGAWRRSSGRSSPRAPSRNCSSSRSRTSTKPRSRTVTTPSSA